MICTQRWSAGNDAIAVATRSISSLLSTSSSADEVTNPATTTATMIMVIRTSFDEPTSRPARL